MGEDPTEAARVEALRAYGILDSPPEASFDRLTALAARACGTPIAVVALVDADRLWFKSSVGEAEHEVARAMAFCAHTIERRATFAVHDALLDDRFVDNPYVAGGPRLRSYHGVPLLSPDGVALGTLAVLDRVPRRLDRVQTELLEVLAEQVMVQLESRRQISARDELNRELDRLTRALAESAERYQQLFDANPQPMWIHDVDSGRFLAVNDAAVGLYGHDRADFLQRTLADLHVADDRDGRVVTAEADGWRSGLRRHRHRDGRVIHVDVASHPLSYDGRAALMVNARPVSQPEFAERQSVERAEQLRTMFERVSDGVLAVGRDWRYTYVNAAAERLIRRPASDIIGTSLWDASPRFAALAGDELRQAMVDGRTRQFELDSEHGDRWAEVRVYPSADGLYLYARDITEQRLAAEAARVNDERFRAVATATTDAIYDWDLVAGTVWGSDGLHRMFGHDPSSWEPHNWADLVHPGDREEVTRSRRQFIRGTDAVWTSEYRFRRADGTYGVVLDRAYAIRRSDGWLLRLVGGMTDVTALREAEARTNRSQHLEAVGQLTGGVAHDFNNLLTVILGTSETLVAELDDRPDLQVMADMARSAALRGGELTHRLLAFARRQPLEPRGTDVDELIGQFDVLLRRTLPEHIDIEVIPGVGIWPAYIDPAQLEDALLNLCLNARDAMPEGGRLTIETANATIDQDDADRRGEVQAGDYVVIAVSDTGTGIDPALVDRIFEPFYSTKPHGAGSGLGLSMVHGFVKQSLGHVAVYSEPGEGTTIRMYLPRAHTEAPVDRARSDTFDQLGGTETILLVEDDDLVRRFAVEHLRALGYEVLEAGNGAEALARLDERPDVALLFTDVVMPGGMSGRELAERATATYPHLRVLYTSGYTENAIVHHGRLDPGVHLLAKPYRLAEFARKVRAVLDEPR